MIDKRYFIVKNKLSDGDAKVFASGSLQGDTLDILKMDRDGVLPSGSSVVEYSNGDEARIASMSVVFNDYSAVPDLEFTTLYEAYTTNDKNLGRLLRQSVNAWSAKNASNWLPSYHTAAWVLYDAMEQRLSDGALIPAYYNFLAIPNSIVDPVSTDTIDLSSLNSLIASIFAGIFSKYPR